MRVFEQCLCVRERVCACVDESLDLCYAVDNARVSTCDRIFLAQFMSDLLDFFCPRARMIPLPRRESYKDVVLSNFKSLAVAHVDSGLCVTNLCALPRSAAVSKNLSVRRSSLVYEPHKPN